MVSAEEPRGESILAVDVGSVNTRALLFDIVEGRYRFLAGGQARTTAGAPIDDSREGMRLAVKELETIAVRELLNEEGQLLRGSSQDNTGVDGVVATFSAGKPLRAVAVGLQEQISLAAARRVLDSNYTKLGATFSLNGSGEIAEKIDAILRCRPDLIVIAGGTDDGATKTPLKLIDSLGMALQLLPPHHNLQVLFAGNQKIATEVTQALEIMAAVHRTANLVPRVGVVQIDPAVRKLSDIVRQAAFLVMPGLKELDAWSGDRLQPTARAFGRVIRFLSRVYDDPGKGILGIDVGASNTAVATAFDEDLRLKVTPGLGMGEGLAGLLRTVDLRQITRWVAEEVSEDYVRDYIHNKIIFPASLPVTPLDLAVEQALAREVMRLALWQAARDFPADIARPAHAHTQPWFEPLLVSGATLAGAPTLAQSLMMVLDGLEPAGITRVILDKNSLTAALGAVAALNPMLPVQVLESNTFIHLGYVIAPVGSARPGSPLLRLKVVHQDGRERSYSVDEGSLQAIPLGHNQTARVHVQPLQGTDVGLGGPGKGGWLRVIGGAFGLVVDARGRPLRLPSDDEQRRDTLKKWYWSLTH